MNKLRFKLVFSRRMGMWVPIAEIAKSQHGASIATAAISADSHVQYETRQPGWRVALGVGLLWLAGCLSSFSPAAFANGANTIAPGTIPLDGVITSGAGVINTNVTTSTVNVNTTTDKAIVHWNGGFNVGSDATVNFRMPGTTSSVLNVDLGGAPSQIYGAINANGHVYIVNQNGIYFGAGAQVNVGSLTATTLDSGIEALYNNGITADQNNPAFVGLVGSITVDKDAKIAAATGGRVLLMAPDVTNSGLITAPDGQVILAAGKSIYLQTNNQFAGLLVEVSAGGTAKNLGDIIVGSGNASLVGLAVNQSGMVSATTTVRANGSIYLKAKEITDPNSPGFNVYGDVTLGKGSQTAVKVAVNDQETVKNAQDVAKSEVKIEGKNITIDGSIIANSGNVTVTGNTTAGTSKVYLGENALIDVSGVDATAPMSRNQLAIQLFSQQLNDSPVLRGGGLFGQTLYLDARKGTSIISQSVINDALQSQERTVAERMTGGGSVSLLGDTVITRAGSVVDMSAGKTTYLAGNIRESRLYFNGQWVNASDAVAGVPYTAINDQYTVTDTHWGVTKTWDLAGTNNGTYQASYVEGHDAGTMTVNAAQLALQGDVKAETTVGTYQRGDFSKFSYPSGGTLAITYRGAGAFNITDQVKLLPQDFTSNSTLDDAQQNLVELDTAILGQGVNHLSVSTTSATVNVNSRLETSPMGSVTLDGNGGVNVNQNIRVAGGDITLSGSQIADVVIKEGVAVSSAGLYTNDLAGVSGAMVSPIVTNGGNVTVSDGLILKNGATIDASAGAWVKRDGTVSAGHGGDVAVTLAQNQLQEGAITSYGMTTNQGATRGGKLTVSLQPDIGTSGVNNIQLGGVNPQDADTLWLSENFFTRGGFSGYVIDNSSSSVGSVMIGDAADHATVIHPTESTRFLSGSYTAAGNGTALGAVTAVTTLPAVARSPVSLAVKSGNQLVLNSQAAIVTDVPTDATGARGDVSLSSRGQMTILGDMTAPAANVNLSITRDFNTNGNVALPNGAFDHTLSLFVGENARISATAQYINPPKADGNLRSAQVANAGNVTLSTANGVLILKEGSVIDVSGTSGAVDLQTASGYSRQQVDGAAGTINLTARDGLAADGSLLGRASGTGAAGTLKVTLGGANSAGTEDVNATTQLYYPNGQRILTVTQDKQLLAAGNSAGSTVSNLIDTSAADQPLTNAVGKGQISQAQIAQGGFDNVSLAVKNVDSNLKTNAIVFDQGVTLAAPSTVTLDATALSGAANVQASQVILQNNSGTTLTAQEVVAGAGALNINGRFVDVIGNVAATNVAQLNISSLSDIRLRGVTGSLAGFGTLVAPQAITLDAAQVYPSTATTFTVSAAGDNSSITIQNTQSRSSSMPLSAQGNVTFNADNITQNGTVRAPLGQISFGKLDPVTNQLGKAQNIVFGAGSLTSVSAEGSLIPYAVTVLGGSQMSNDEGSDKTFISALTGKKINVNGVNVDTQDKAKLDISSGGDTQAFEWIQGIGGSTDILNTAGYYAVLPSLANQYAPYDYNMFGSSDVRLGQAITLAGGNGLSAGTYTLLPAHYALLPGAYLIKVDSSPLPINTQTAQLDGSSLMSGYMTKLDGTSRGQYTSFNVQSGNVFYANAGTKNYKGPAEYKITYGNAFFTKKAITDNTDTSPLAADAGQLTIAASEELNLDGTIVAKKTAGGKGALVDISSNNIQVVSQRGTATAGVLQIEASQLSQIEADSVLLGGTRTVSGNTQTISTEAAQVTFSNDADHQARLGELIVTATDRIQVDSGAVITTTASTGQASETVVKTSGAGAVLAVSANHDFNYARTDANNQSGTVTIAQGASVNAARSAVMDATQSADKSGSLTVASGGSLTLGANQFVLGDDPNATGTRIDQTTLQSYGALNNFTFNSYQNIDVYGNVGFGNSQLNLTLNSSGVAHHGSGDLNIVANTLTLKNTLGTTFTPPADAGAASLTMNTQNIVLGSASAGSGDSKGFNLAGFDSVHLNADKAITLRDSGQLNVTAANTVLNSAVITADSGAVYTVNASGNLQTTGNGLQAAATSGIGANVTLSSQQTTLGGNIELLAGALTAKSTNGALVVASGARVAANAATKQFDATHADTTDAGSITLASSTGNVVVQQKALVDVSGGAQKGAAGTLTVNATNGQFVVADGSLKATAATGEKTGTVKLDVNRMDDFSAVNTALESGHFNQSRDVRVRNGDVTIAAGDTVTSQQFTLGVDKGNANIAGTINADGAKGGDVAIYANGLVTLASSAKITAKGTQANQSVGDTQTGAGGTVLLSSNSTTTVNAVSAESGALIDVGGYQAAAHNHSGVNGAGGTVTLIGRRGTSGSDTAKTVNVAFNTTGAVRGASEVNVEGMRTYTATTFSSNIAGLVADTNSFYQANSTAGSYQATQDGGSIRVLPYILVKSTAGNTPTAMNVTADINLRNFGTLMAGQGGMLALLSNGNLTMNGSLSDGFSTATSAGVFQANTHTFNYQLVAGADYTAANKLQTVAGVGNLTLGANKIIRTGEGNISMVAGGDITLGNNATVYTIGDTATTLAGFTLPSSISTLQNPNVINAASYVKDGGDIYIASQGNITGSATTQSVNQWLLRQGGNGTDTSWWVRNDLFNQGVAALGGGNVVVNAAGNITNLSASSATNAQTVKTTVDGKEVFTSQVNGGGDVTVNSGGNITNGVYYVGRGQLDIHADGSILKSSVGAMGTTLALQDASAKVSAGNDLRIDTVFNPTLWVQGSTISTANASASTFFNTYGDNSALHVASLTGEVEIGQQTKTSLSSNGLSTAGYSTVSGNDLGAVHPGQVYATAFNGDLTVYKMILAPSAQGQLELMAEGSVIGASPTSTINTPVAQIIVSDADMVSVLSMRNPATGAPSTDSSVKALLTSVKSGNATTPVHQGDTEPVVIIAKEGDVQLLGSPQKSSTSNIYGIQSAKPVYISAGNNVALSASIQNNNAGDISIIKAGNDFVMQNGFEYAAVNVNGPGELIVQAGRNIDLGNTSGIQSLANNVNANLPQKGANVTLLAGVGKSGASVDTFVDQYIDPNGSGPANASSTGLSDYRKAVASMVKTYMEQRSGTSLTADQAMQQFLALDTDQQAPLAYAVFHQEMVFAIKDYVVSVDTGRGDAAVASLFPREDYSGDILMYQSQVRTARDANINIMVPGGLLNAGVAANTALDHDIGIVTERGGNINVYAEQGFQVNQSKVATLFGGDLSAWVNNGDIDAGRGSKTAVSVPKRVINTDNDGNVTVEVKGVATGSGLSTSTYDPDGPNGPQTSPKAGTVYLAAPRGALDAGEAGVSSGGDLFVGAPVILNSSNISAAGSSNVPATDTGSLAAAQVNTSNTAAGVSNSMTENLASQMPSQDVTPKELPAIVTVKTIRLEE